MSQDIGAERSYRLEDKTNADEAKGEIVRVRRRQGRAARTRQNIIAAATAEFASSGFEGATTRSIAARADVPHGLVLYHFETKLGVWQAVLENALQDFHQRFRKRLKELEGQDDPTRLRELHRTYIYMAAEHPELNWILSHEVGGEGDAAERLNWVLENTIGEDADISIELIRKSQALGMYVEGDPAHLHYLHLGAASRVFEISGEIRRTMKQSPFDKSFLERHVELIERLFWRKLPPLFKPKR